MQRARTFPLDEVARLSGLPVRALERYEALGLLARSATTPAGSREYSRDDLLRLLMIMIDRELGLGDEEIRGSLEHAALDRRRALLERRAELERRGSARSGIVNAIGAAVALIDRVNDATIVEEVCDAPSRSLLDDAEAPVDDRAELERIFAGFGPHADPSNAR